MMYQISSGQGPAECELGVAKLLGYLASHYDITVINKSSGYNEGTYRSVSFYTDADLSEFLGSVVWVCKSPYRPAHKRKNWFLDFSPCAVAHTEEFDPEQVVFDTFRSGGKGGQNVNKVETGVRAIYVPTGQAVVCTEERNQHTNKRLALERLRAQIEEANRQSLAESKNEDWRAHTRIVRGNAAVRFEGMGFVRR